MPFSSSSSKSFGSSAVVPPSPSHQSPLSPSPSPASSNHKSTFHLFGFTRYFMLALSTVCLTIVISNSLALNFTIICMDSTVVASAEADDANGTFAATNVVPQTMFSLYQQGWLFSALAIGQLIGSLPITFITTKCGIRLMFTAYGILSSLATIAIPLSIALGGFPLLMVMRIFQGIGIASIWVVIGSVSAEWAPLSSSGIFLSILSCNLQIGPVITMPLAGQLCSSPNWGWPPVYYILGTLSLLFFLSFFCFFRDSPRQHRHISDKEMAQIQFAKLPTVQGKAPKTPYCAILSDPVFWGLFTSNTSGNTAFQIFWLYGPLYLNKALGMEVAKTGMAAALPFLLGAIFKIMAGQISDRITFISERGKVIMFASISQYLMACCFLALAILPMLGLANITVMQSCLTAATIFSGLNTVGVVKSTQLVSRQFSHVLFSLLMDNIDAQPDNAGCASYRHLVDPTPTNSLDEWAHVYFVISAIVIACTTFFNFTAEVEPRPWTKMPESSNHGGGKGVEGIFTVERSKKKPNEEDI